MTQPKLTFMSTLTFIPLKKLFFILCFAFIASTTFADSITVETDRQNVEMGDIITLSVQTDFQTKGSNLDLSQLKDQFDVINQQQSNQIAIINGQYSSYTQWRIQLLPKQAGNLMIPAFEINDVKSKPYPIHVTEAVYADGSKPYFLEAETDKTQAYVQEQVIYTLRFYHKGSLINGNIRPPKFNDALVESLKEQSVFGKTINGQQYTVYEWQYAIFPQASGQLSIAGPSFTGLLHLRTKQKGVQAVAEPTIIKVLPAEKSPAPYWLPASDVTLSQKWENVPKEIQVGDSLRRIITLNVKGLKASQLPNITTQNGTHFKVYADEAKTSQTLSEKGVQSIKLISQAIVATQAGTLTLPDEKITWWNTETQKFEEAILKTEPLTIWPIESNKSNQIPDITQSTNITKNTENSLPGSTQSYQQRYQQNVLNNHDTLLSLPIWVWPLLVAIVVSLWLITLLILLRTRKQIKEVKSQILLTGTTPLIATEHTFNHKWCDMPLPEFYKELLRQLHDELQINSVDAIPIERLRKAIFQLEAHLFAGEKLGYDTQQTICDNWASLITQKNTATKKKGELNSLYNNG
ncbi:BatD family protein [Thiomicrorhabdus sp. Kp2]|uniref:BatD family protein n=1 Tax=Thiomicrorhabdus sp. Kp2 TaxID=1123518 RepID=UPI000415CD00|nr:BatD family protein [Thiomicrorhabdus sp. Kp2]